MLRLKLFSAVSFILLACCFVFANERVALAQEQGSTTAGTMREEVNYDVQLDLIVASNNPSEKGGVPESLSAIVKQLRASLPFTNYRLTTTFINRVKDGGTLETMGVGSSLLATTIGPSTPTFYNFNLSQVKMERDARGQPFIRIPKFRFNLRMPIITGTTLASAGNASSPVINYEAVGISTEMSIHEGVPTLVGTLTTSRPEELMILLISMKQSSQR
ncbi:MAG TPA: hypothetical protein VM911_22255 [Pyrinomonadaceae bacterium]|jgi:hypothetical protein|nr:hypothetical protein [Pyrinomonadaceae bacterium]